MQSRETKKSGMQQCQRCLKYGHWTYECKNEPIYVYRPSRTMQYKEPNLRQELNLDKGPKTHIQDRDVVRAVKRDESSDEEASSDSSSSSSSSDTSSESSQKLSKSPEKKKIKK